MDDVLVLPRLPELDPAGTAFRPVRRLTTAQIGFEGEGFPVRRAFAGVLSTELDPFIHMDHIGEVEQAPGEPMGTPWHPHRGFETVTYLLDGAVEHQDSNGGGGLITDGDTQWMTAGSGILHIEQPPEWLVQSGGVAHGVQPKPRGADQKTRTARPPPQDGDGAGRWHNPAAPAADRNGRPSSSRALDALAMRRTFRAEIPGIPGMLRPDYGLSNGGPGTWRAGGRDRPAPRAG